MNLFWYLNWKPSTPRYEDDWKISDWISSFSRICFTEELLARAFYRHNLKKKLVKKILGVIFKCYKKSVWELTFYNIQYSENRIWQNIKWPIILPFKTTLYVHMRILLHLFLYQCKSLCECALSCTCTHVHGCVSVPLSTSQFQIENCDANFQRVSVWSILFVSLWIVYIWTLVTS